MSMANNLLTDSFRNKLERVFDFLIRNRRFNEVVQHAGYRKEILPWPDTGSKLRSLLHSKAHTQSSPKLDTLMPTWEKLHENYEAFNQVESPVALNEALWTLAKPNVTRDKNNRPVFEEMWTALDKVAGFGPKTAALFVKSIVEIHTLPINQDLRFLPDFRVDPQDKFKVPVDTVIQHIFSSIGLPSANFTSINELITLSELSCAERPTLWDDLWFWGFITQKIEKINEKPKRINCINPPKFWSILGAPTDSWDPIFNAAQEFLQIIEPEKA